MVYYIPTVVWAFIIIWLSVMPAPNLPKMTLFEPDKLGHIGVYAILCIFMLWGIYKNKINLVFNTYIWVALGASLLGYVLEIVQKNLSTGRIFDTYDILANIIGAILGTGVYYFLFKK